MMPLRVIEKIMKEHFSWQKKAVSRREFFALLRPFGKKCSHCGDEQAV